MVRKDIDAFEQYTPVKPLEVLAEEIGVPVSQLCKLDANEVRRGLFVFATCVRVHYVRCYVLLAAVMRESSVVVEVVHL